MKRIVTTPNASDNVNKLITHTLLVVMQNCTATLENSLMRFFLVFGFVFHYLKLKIFLLYSPAFGCLALILEM